MNLERLDRTISPREVITYDDYMQLGKDTFYNEYSHVLVIGIPDVLYGYQAIKIRWISGCTRTSYRVVTNQSVKFFTPTYGLDKRYR